MAPIEFEDAGSEHPVAAFVLVASVLFAVIFLIAQATGGSSRSGQGGGNSAQPFESTTPAGGGSGEVQVLEPAPSPAAAPVAVIEAPPSPEPPPAPAPTAPPPPVSASAYAIVERSCGALDFGFNEHARLAPASLTKIITSLLVAKHEATLNDIVEVSISGSQMRKQGSSIMGIEPGQRYSMRDLLYGLMLPSGNDAAMTIAQYLGGGDVNRFVQMMNEEAAALGMADSHFSNPHGLDERDLYSSAYDMALAGRAALDTPLLFEVSNARNWTTGSGLSFRNGNKLLNTYPGANGVKIGFTTNAKQTIVAAADRDGRSLIVSVFGSEDRYADSAALLNWAFDHVPSRC